MIHPFSQITLGDEYNYACGILGLSQETLYKRIIAAAQASFLLPMNGSSLYNLYRLS